MPSITEALRAALQHHQAGRLPEAEAIYRQVLKAHPQHPDALHLLGLLAHQVGRHALAIKHIGRAIVLNPKAAEFHNNIGVACLALGKLEEAEGYCRQALTLQPDFAEACVNLGNALKTQDRLEEAIAQYRQALALKPAYAEAHYNLGAALQVEGKLEEAVAHYRQVMTLQPDDGVRIKLATILPVILGSHQEAVAVRRKYEENLSALLEQDLCLKDPVKEVGRAHFYLTYHGRNDRETLVKLARLYARACPALAYVAPHCSAPVRSRPGAKIKIGFISKFFCNHSIGKSTSGVLAKLPRQRFHVCAVFVPPVADDDISRFIRRSVDEVIVLPNDLQAARRRLSEKEFDILYYQDIGMDPFTYFLAFARLAPVQCVRSGHPGTTGIPALDYFITTESAEPEHAEEHYSETLVKLKTPVSASYAYYYRPTIPDPLRARAEYGLEESEHLYICPQTLFKFHPDFDEILSGILQGDPRGRLVLVGSKTAHWAELLLRRFRRTMPHVVDRITVLPPQPVRDFINLIALSDVMLDTIHFGGFHTSLEAFAVGTPVVTCPGEFQRSRNTYAFYNAMGFLDCVAEGPEHYVEIAVRLGTDAAYRAEIKRRILARNHVLYEDMDVVREYEGFFLSAMDRARP